ncbi:hypothetical protein NPIL_280861 [Nephila pilipes]|uniref:Uncharacterized protein n=1 Tax=Nephila pilipes TaxID=299642 RepID=A0A8X6II43_NEPPI|nr:hypothetical protein NPIL_280861 [Nephila pilipes]
MYYQLLPSVNIQKYRSFLELELKLVFHSRRMSVLWTLTQNPADPPCSPDDWLEELQKNSDQVRGFTSRMLLLWEWERSNAKVKGANRLQPTFPLIDVPQIDAAE